MFDDLKPNRFGKYKKEEIIRNGYKIIDYGKTATEINRLYGITMTKEDRKKHFLGFKTGRGYRGYSPSFDDIDVLLQYDMIDKLE
jgi:hypothetical protein